jgi:hypothetical protein
MRGVGHQVVEEHLEDGSYRRITLAELLAELRGPRLGHHRVDDRVNLGLLHVRPGLAPPGWLGGASRLALLRVAGVTEPAGPPSADPGCSTTVTRRMFSTDLGRRANTAGLFVPTTGLLVERT